MSDNDTSGGGLYIIKLSAKHYYGGRTKCFRRRQAAVNLCLRNGSRGLAGGISLLGFLMQHGLKEGHQNGWDRRSKGHAIQCCAMILTRVNFLRSSIESRVCYRFNSALYSTAAVRTATGRDPWSMRSILSRSKAKALHLNSLTQRVGAKIKPLSFL